LQNAPGNFGGKLGNGSFDFTAGRSEFGDDARFAGGNLRGSRSASLFGHRGALIECPFTRSFLFGVNLPAGLPQGVLVLLNLLDSGSPSRFRSLLRAHGPSVAFGHDRKQRLKENRPQDEVKKEDDQDCRHSLKEEFS
jgi:hypothetical protein